MMPGRRKKWSEAEERSLIDKYGEMVSDGTLGKMKTREKKFKPIALHVNSVHHVRDPIAFPWQWCWKDVSTKVQNMRHQYLLVKQKVKKPQEPGSEEEDFDWVEGLAHWSNFLRYKEVFGDFSGSGGSGVSGGGTNGDLIGFSGGGSELGLDIAEFEESGGFGNGVMGLGFGDDEEGFVYEEVNPSGASDPSKRIKKKKNKDKKKKEKNGSRVGLFLLGNKMSKARRRKKRWGILGSRLKEEREKEEREREWEEKMDRRRREWKERMEEMMGRHREEMAQMQTRILQEQQGLTNQLLGVVAQWAAAAHQPPVVDHAAAATNHYFSQMMQSLNHVNGLDSRVDGHNQDDHFIVDAS